VECRKKEVVMNKGVDFTNIFSGAFMCTESQKRKKTVSLTVFFALLVSACINAAHKMKLTSVVNFINILHTNFLYERYFGSFFYIHVTREKLPERRSYEKFSCKMLMKLTPGEHLLLLFLCFWFSVELFRKFFNGFFMNHPIGNSCG
jgi:hypothetical protein